MAAMAGLVLAGPATQAVSLVIDDSNPASISISWSDFNSGGLSVISQLPGLPPGTLLAGPSAAGSILLSDADFMSAPGPIIYLAGNYVTGPQNPFGSTTDIEFHDLASGSGNKVSGMNPNS